MAAGRYRHFITVQSNTLSKNSYAEDDSDWNDDFDCFANVRPLRGNDFHFARQTQSVITHKIEMRFQLLSNGEMIKKSNARIIFHDIEDRIFTINSIIDINERHKDLELMCVEET